MAENNPSAYKLFSSLSKDGLYTKSFDEFKAKYSTPEAQAKLHSGLVSDGLYTKSLNDFKSQYFTVTPTAQKKNPNPTPQVGKGASALPSTLAGGKSSSGLPQPKSVSVTPGKSQGALLMATEKPKTAEDFLQIEKEKRDVLSPDFYGGPAKKQQQPKIEAPKKVGALEDIGNTFMSSLNRFASGIAELPDFANKAALMMLTKTYGLDEEYNALPVQKKKELNDAISNLVSSGSISPTVTGGISGVMSPRTSRETQEYFIKKVMSFSIKQINQISF